MQLQLSRFLVKQVAAAIKGSPLPTQLAYLAPLLGASGLDLDAAAPAAARSAGDFHDIAGLRARYAHRALVACVEAMRASYLLRSGRDCSCRPCGILERFTPPHPGC